MFPGIAEQYQISWPIEGAHNGWLALDRNGNGTIDDFGELFGNLTVQPQPPSGKQKNGFAALAVYDTPGEGGNGDGWITSDDAIFPKLRVWVDLNHDGQSQPEELYTLSQVGITAISLDYRLSKITDVNGNVFRYRSSVMDAQGGEASKTIYDVFLEIGDSRKGVSNSAVDLKEGWSPLPIYVNFDSQTPAKLWL